MNCAVCGSEIKSTGGQCPNGCQQYQLKHVGKTPHKCPVCYGTGNVAAGFYGPYRDEGDSRVWTSSGTAMETCRSCDGSGIVWG